MGPSHRKPRDPVTPNPLPERRHSNMDRTFTVFVLGDWRVGRTSFINAIFPGSDPQQNSRSSFVTVDNVELKIILKDNLLSDYGHLASSIFFPPPDGCFIMFDLSNLASFIHCSEIIRGYHGLNQSLPANFKEKILLGNKSDLLADQKVVKEEDISKLKDSENLSYYEISTKNTGDSNLHESFRAMCRMLMRKRGIGVNLNNSS